MMAAHVETIPLKYGAKEYFEPLRPPYGREMAVWSQPWIQRVFKLEACWINEVISMILVELGKPYSCAQFMCKVVIVHYE